MSWHKAWYILALGTLLVGLLPVAAMASRAGWSKVDPLLLQRLSQQDQVRFHIVMAAQTDVAGAVQLRTKEEKGTYVFELLTRTARQTSNILLILAAALLLGYALSNVYATQTMADGLMTMDLGKWGIFVMINLFILALGFFLPPAAIILLVVPIFTPPLRDLGFDLIWYGIVLMMPMQIALCLPTVGLNILTIKPMVPEITIGQLFKASIPFLINILIMILILCIWPNLALWLPNLLIK